MRSVIVLVAVGPFGGTVYETSRLPVLERGSTDIPSIVPDTVHVHESWVFTRTVPRPPPAGMVAVDGDSVKEQPRCVTVCCRVPMVTIAVREDVDVLALTL